jgi:hypothetical protein
MTTLHRPLLGLILASALGLPVGPVLSQGMSPGASPERTGCLDGVCIAAPISSLPKNIAWAALDPQTLRSYFTPGTKDVGEQPFAAKRVADGAAFAKRTFPAQPVDYAVLGNSMGLQTGGFDAKLLPVLTQLRIACKPFTWTGRYNSPRGELTEVVLMLYPSQSGEPNEMRVQRITRYFAGVAMGTEMQALRESLQSAIAMPINDKGRKDGDLSPVANLSRLAARDASQAAAILEINDIPPGRFDYRQFEQQAACKP